MKILILGATGMLGSAMFREFHEKEGFDTWGTIRDPQGFSYFAKNSHAKLIHSVDVLDDNHLLSLFQRLKPDLVINCIGLIKQLAAANDPLVVLPINAMFPHRLARLATTFNARLIHISTDCVFSGKKGLYKESDPSDADDLYGKSKFIGELPNSPGILTLRTSMIGHELNSQYALVDWFLAEQHQVKGYVNAIFSGLPTNELTRIVMDYIIPHPHLYGLYHVAAHPINKFDLLHLVARVYGKKISIIPDEQVHIDRSLNADRFNTATGYVAPEWSLLIQRMHQSYVPSEAVYV